MKVFLVTEGGYERGYGHLMRCLSLYEAFEERKIIPRIIVDSDETADDLLRFKNKEILYWLKEKGMLFDKIQGSDIAIIDSYQADYQTYEGISHLAKTAVYIDDNMRVNYPKGIILNGSVYAEELEYPENDGIRYLLGSKYVLLRRDFCNMPGKNIRDEIENVMITFGGDDGKNMTPGILKLLVENYPGITKKVVIGKGFKNIEELMGLKGEGVEFVFNPDARGMKEIMLEVDIAISAGGQTLYELSRVGVPTIAVAVADNQLKNVMAWQKAGFIRYAGWYQDEEISKKVRSSIAQLKDFLVRSDMSRIGRGLVDGFGAYRTVDYLLSYV